MCKRQLVSNIITCCPFPNVTFRKAQPRRWIRDAKPAKSRDSCVFLLALSVVIGSSCTPRQQQTTLRIWQTAVDPKAVAVLKEIGAEFERTHPGVRVEIESVAWGGTCRQNSLPQSGRVTRPT